MTALRVKRVANATQPLVSGEAMLARRIACGICRFPALPSLGSFLVARRQRLGACFPINKNVISHEQQIGEKRLTGAGGYRQKLGTGLSRELYERTLFRSKFRNRHSSADPPYFETNFENY